jgi:Sulfate permease and related transporters (MFS superfamily)
MSDSAKPVFLVDPFSDPIVIRIDGRASFQNSSCIHDFFNERIREGKTRFVVDFQNCASMDSTFLGVIAGAGLQLRKLNPPGSLVLARVGARNLELVRNLGLHRLVTVDTGDTEISGQPSKALTCETRTELESARMVLEAHENLVVTDESNRSKFQDVLAFLRTRVEQE